MLSQFIAITVAVCSRFFAMQTNVLLAGRYRTLVQASNSFSVILTSKHKYSFTHCQALLALLMERSYQKQNKNCSDYFCQTVVIRVQYCRRILRYCQDTYTPIISSAPFASVFKQLEMDFALHFKCREMYALCSTR